MYTDPSQVKTPPALNGEYGVTAALQSSKLKVSVRVRLWAPTMKGLNMDIEIHLSENVVDTLVTGGTITIVIIVLLVLVTFISKWVASEGEG